VLDELLASWRSRSRPAFTGITLLGHQWSAETQAAKEFLARNQVPYRHLDVSEPAAGRLLAAAGLSPDVALPVVLLPEGEVLHRPSLRELATRAGLTTEAGSPFYDLVVVGGGPAGLGAAVYGASEGLRTLLVERAATGGQAGQSSRIENYLGFPKGLSGAELAQRARDQALRFGVEVVTASEVTGIEPQGDGRVVHLDGAPSVTAHAVVLATGVSYTRLPAASVDAFSGRGVYYGAATHEAVNCTDQDVYVVGAANSAGQAALFFRRYAAKVVIVARGADLRRSMSEYLVARIEEDPKIEVRTCTEVVGADGDEHLEVLDLRENTTGTVEQVKAGWLFVFIGAVPRTDWLGERFARDRRGFVLTGLSLLDAEGRPPPDWPLERAPYLLESSVPGVFVAGDVRAASMKRVASAVGDGAMAVSLVHTYLERA
jgi:thioredoxin reductase (NADPH)